jgi:hypothetical protein
MSNSSPSSAPAYWLRRRDAIERLVLAGGGATVVTDHNGKAERITHKKARAEMDVYFEVQKITAMEPGTLLRLNNWGRIGAILQAADGGPMRAMSDVEILVGARLRAAAERGDIVGVKRWGKLFLEAVQLDEEDRRAMIAKIKSEPLH